MRPQFFVTRLTAFTSLLHCFPGTETIAKAAASACAFLGYPVRNLHSHAQLSTGIRAEPSCQDFLSVLSSRQIEPESLNNFAAQSKEGVKPQGIYALNFLGPPRNHFGSLSCDVRICSRHRKTTSVSTAVGIQIHTISLGSTARPRIEKNRPTPMGETRIGVQGKKYR
jgi:hypothetical protein